MFSFRSCFYPLCLPPYVSPPQGHVVFDASGSRMAWTLIEQLQCEHRDVGGWGGQLGGQAGAGPGNGAEMGQALTILDVRCSMRCCSVGTLRDVYFPL